MKNEHSTDLKRAVAETIGLRNTSEAELLNDLDIVQSSDGVLKVMTSDRETFDMLLGLANRPKEAAPLSENIRRHVENDSEHRPTADAWPTGPIPEGNTPKACEEDMWGSSEQAILSKYPVTATVVRTVQPPASGRVRSVPRATMSLHDNREALLPLSDVDLSDSEHLEIIGRFMLERSGRVPSRPSESKTNDMWRVKDAPAPQQSLTDSKSVDTELADGPLASQYLRNDDFADIAVSPEVDFNNESTGETEYQTVLTSLPPPPETVIKKRIGGVVALAAAAVLLLVGGASWYWSKAALPYDRTGYDAGLAVVPAVMIQPVMDDNTQIQPVLGKVVPVADETLTTVATLGNASKIDQNARIGEAASAQKSVDDSRLNHQDDDLSAQKGMQVESPLTLIPSLPSERDIKMAMARIAPEMKKCNVGESGQVVVKLVVSGRTGKVLSAQTVDETFMGTVTGLCAARIAHSVTFPLFEKEKLTVKYPFEL